VKVYFSALAVSDLEQIRDFLAVQDITAASRLLDEVDRTCRNLEPFPELGVNREDIEFGLRMLLVRKHYAIFYRVVAPSVEIVRVIHAARDFDRLFDNGSS